MNLCWGTVDLVCQNKIGEDWDALALSALAPVYGKIYCHELSHINTDECGAPELFTGGAKLNPIRSSNGRINAKELDEIVRGSGNGIL